MYHSYVMGMDHSIWELQYHGFDVEQEGDNYMVAFPKEKAPAWEDFISRHLAVGYWNEYLAEDRVIFLFHLEDGMRRYEVFHFQNDEVLSLCEGLCERSFGSLRDMLAGNHYYRNFLDRNLLE